MNNLVKFNGPAGHQLRSIVFNNETVFLCQEVGPALGYSDLSHSIRTSAGMRENKEFIIFTGANLNSIKELLSCVGPTDRPLQLYDSIKFSPALICLTVAGLRKLVLRSDKPECAAYQDWVIYEVLPSIEKTGGYTLPQARTVEQEAAICVENWLIMAALLEVPKHLAQIEAIKAAEMKTGLNLHPLIAAAPAQDNIPDREIMLEPTELGVHLNLSARKINQLLLKIGWQIRENGNWVPTDTGKKHCSPHSWKRGSKTGYNLKWSLKSLKQVLGAE